MEIARHEPNRVCYSAASNRVPGFRFQNIEKKQNIILNSCILKE